MQKIEKLIIEMIKYYSGDAKRIQHFTKVHSYSKLIGSLERLDDQTLEILEVAAVVHDIGIKVAEEKYGVSNGKYQEQEGPSIAKEMLETIGYSEKIVERVCYLVGHHHTYSNIDKLDYQILVEADFLVNIYEDSLDKNAINTAYEKIFKTKSGKMICKEMFNF